MRLNTAKYNKFLPSTAQYGHRSNFVDWIMINYGCWNTL